MTSVEEVFLQAVVPLRELEVILYSFMALILLPFLRITFLAQDIPSSMMEIGIRLSSPAQGGFWGTPI